MSTRCEDITRLTCFLYQENSLQTEFTSFHKRFKYVSDKKHLNKNVY